MNTITTLHTEYIKTAWKTLESVRVNNQITHKDFWIYNDGGVHFRLFTSYGNAISFLNNQIYNYWMDFENEAILDAFLQQLEL